MSIYKKGSYSELIAAKEEAEENNIFNEKLDHENRYANGMALEDWEEECEDCGNPKDIGDRCSYCFPDDDF